MQPIHLRLAELILILAFPLLAPYWFAAMIGRRRWRAVSEGVVAAVCAVLLSWIAMMGSFLLDDDTHDLYYLLFMVLIVVLYLIGGVGAWLIATRAIPRMPEELAVPRWLRQSGAYGLFMLLLLQLTALSTGWPHFLHEYLHATFDAVDAGVALLGISAHEFGLLAPMQAAFDMAGQKAWLASLIWLTTTCGLAVLTLRAYRAEERRRRPAG